MRGLKLDIGRTNTASEKEDMSHVCSARGKKQIDMRDVAKTKDGDIDLEGVPVDHGWAWILLSGKYMYITPLLTSFVNGILEEQRNSKNKWHSLSTEEQCRLEK